MPKKDAGKKEKKNKKATKTSFAKVDDPFKVIKYVLMTEKAIQGIELQNKLVFIVDVKATKPAIKKSIEAAFQSAVVDVRVINDQKQRKKAVVKFRDEGAAADIAMRLGML